jgi:hypothetical protein
VDCSEFDALALVHYQHDHDDQELDDLEAECPASGPTHLVDIGYYRQIVAVDSRYLPSDLMLMSCLATAVVHVP